MILSLNLSSISYALSVSATFLSLPRLQPCFIVPYFNKPFQRTSSKIGCIRMSDNQLRRAPPQHNFSADRGASTTHEDNPNFAGADSRTSYTFIDSRAQQPRSNEAVRVHVMRESHRARRLAQGQATSTRGGEEMHLWDIDEPSAAQLPRSLTTKQPSLKSTPRIFSLAQSASLAEDRGLLLRRSPIDILGASRRDPFAQYPALQSYQVDFLIDFCMSTPMHDL